MLKKFSFWIVFILIGLIGSVIFIHWKTLQGFHQWTARVEPLYQRQKIIDSLTLSLERYRRVSSSFRKMDPQEILQVKEKLKSSFSNGIDQLNQLNPTSDERQSEQKLKEQIADLFGSISKVEPMLFSKDAYQRPEIQQQHAQILHTLSSLEKSTTDRKESLQNYTSRTESQSLLLLLAVGGVIFTLMICMILRNHFVYLKPLRQLHQYACDLKSGQPVPPDFPKLTGMHGEIISALNQLALGVETHMRDRHKFILDVVTDLRAPLTLLQAGKFLLTNSRDPVNEGQQIHAAESVRRGLAIFSGSLDDLNDIVDINRLESRLDVKTVDLAELVSDVSRTLMGSELSKRILVSVPPMPVWVLIDVRRFERVLIQVFSKVMSTLSSGSHLSVSITQSTQGSFRGIEILVQDSERLKNGRTSVSGPEQDILKHWISENGLSMALAHKIIRAHGGSINAAGVAGTSVSITIRLPFERMMSRGLITPPTEDQNYPQRGIVTGPIRANAMAEYKSSKGMG